MSPFKPFDINPYAITGTAGLRVECYISTTPLTVSKSQYTLALNSPQSAASNVVSLAPSDATSLASVIGSESWSVSGDYVADGTIVTQDNINVDTGDVSLSSSTTNAQVNALTFTAQTTTFTESGKWLNVNDGLTYRLGKGSLEETSIQYRKDEVTNAFIEGSFVLNALKQNTIETLVVYVLGETTSDVQYNVKVLTDALSQSSFWVKMIIEDSSSVWRCYAADYVINTPVEFLHARRATVKAMIPRDPNETLGEVV